jgi:hypothetical protein
VELTNGYEKFGDASGGPLLTGDRGVVVDLQRAPNGEQYVLRHGHSIRALTLTVIGDLLVFCTMAGGGGTNRRRLCLKGQV